MPQRTPIWHENLSRSASCPVCNEPGEKRLLVDFDSLIDPYPRLTFATCATCGTIFQLDFEAPRYTSDKVLPAAVKFYVEQGAGLETIVLPACIARREGVQSYFEVGCGFGFGLDFARHAFGWQARGIDPSAIASEGKRLLGLDIESGYLTHENARNGEQFSAIAALEIIEHLAGPREFLDILKARLAPDGILMLTTPDAGFIEFAREKPGYLAVLTPGYHAVIYTAQSLELAMREAGFSDVQVKTRGSTLFAVAGPGAAETDIDNAFDPAIYRDYLEKRFATAESGSILQIGFGYRLFKHFVNKGMYDDGERIMHALAESVRRRDGIDFRDAHGVLARAARQWRFENFVDELPVCLVGLLYFSAMLRLNKYEDRQGAIEFFYTAFITARAFRAAMIEFGIDDAEVADLQRSANEHLRLVLGWMA